MGVVYPQALLPGPWEWMEGKHLTPAVPGHLALLGCNNSNNTSSRLLMVPQVPGALRSPTEPMPLHVPPAQSSRCSGPSSWPLWQTHPSVTTQTWKTSKPTPALTCLPMFCWPLGSSTQWHLEFSRCRVKLCVFPSTARFIPEPVSAQVLRLETGGPCLTLASSSSDIQSVTRSCFSRPCLALNV